jgi:hypothetical protein
MTASGTRTYHGVFKARCVAVKSNEITVYVPQVFGDTPITTTNVVGSYPPPGTFGYVSFEGGDPAYPVWLGTSATVNSSLIGPQGPQGPQGATHISYYGAFQYLGRQAITSTTTAYAMPFDTTDFSSGVIRSNTSHINIVNAGVYNIQWSGQFQNTANSIHDIQIWLRKNGIDVPGSTGFVSIPARKSASAGQEAHEIVGWNYFLQFNANDYFEIVWTADGTTVSLESYVAGTTPITPTTAAIIVTVSMV